MQKLHFDTLLIHAGRIKTDSNSSCVTPIHQTTSFLFDNSEHAADLFALTKPGHIYTRLSNPTTQVLEERVSALENCTAAVAVSSGQSSQFIAIQNIAGAGDNIICSSSLYGGTYNQFKISFAKLGIEFRFASSKETESYEKLIDNRTKAIFIETIGNSDFFIPEFEEFANLSKRHNIPLITDNTFGAGGYLFKPANWGSAIITHAATKWIGGHGTSIGGLVLDSGQFNWANGKFPDFTSPSESYHGLNFWESFGPTFPGGSIAFAVKARAEGLRDWGCSLSPLNAFLLLQGIETLSLRMERVLNNAAELAEWLVKHPKVESVNYPGLKNNPSHEKAKKYFKKGFGGVLTVSLKGSREQSSQFVNSVQLLSHLVNVGDNKTLITHPASTTHAQMSTQALLSAGIGANTLRTSLGIEHIGDIKNDLEQAFKKI